MPATVLGSEEELSSGEWSFQGLRRHRMTKGGCHRGRMKTDPKYLLKGPHFELRPLSSWQKTKCIGSIIHVLTKCFWVFCCCFVNRDFLLEVFFSGILCQEHVLLLSISFFLTWDHGWFVLPFWSSVLDRKLILKLEADLEESFWIICALSLLNLC